MSLSQPSTSRAIKEVANALCQPQILNNWIRFPANREELQQLRLRLVLIRYMHNDKKILDSNIF